MVNMLQYAAWAIGLLLRFIIELHQYDYVARAEGPQSQWSLSIQWKHASDVDIHFLLF